MESSSLKYFLNCGRDYLCITLDETPKGLTRGGNAAILFLAFNASRFGISLLAPKHDFILLLLGNHFENWGHFLLWTIGAFNIYVVLLIILVISSYFKHTQPDTLKRMTIPLREFLDLKIYDTVYYKVLLKGSELSVVIFFMVGFLGEGYAVMIDARYSKDFGPLLISTMYIYAMGALATYTGSVLSTVAISVDIMCRKLRGDFKIVENRLSSERKLQRTHLLTIRIFDKFCGDVMRYDSHWKRILFTTVIGLTVFMAFAFYLFMFSSLPVIIRRMGSTVISLIYVFLSFCLIAPASVSSANRRLHSKFCSLVFRTQKSSLNLRLKLLLTVKRFQRQISFSLWDTNHIDYMDYLNVSMISRFQLSNNKFKNCCPQFALGLIANFLLVMKLFNK